jgi:hypothetical protein
VSGQEFGPGEVVDITIRGVRVGGRGMPQDPGRLCVDLGPWDDGVNQGREWFLTIPSSVDAVTVTRVAPPEYPPRAGDLWRDRDGQLWFGVDVTDYDADKIAFGVELQGQNTYTYGRWAADEINKRYGPLTLVHREPDGGESGD